MILFLTLLLNMSLSGSCILLAYLAASALLKERFSWRSRYNFLKLCLFLFLSPLSLLKCLLPHSFPFAFGLFFNPGHIELERTLHIGSDGQLVDFIPFPQKCFLLILGWILLLTLLCGFAGYIWMRRTEKRNTVVLSKSQALLDEEKKKQHVAREIHLFHSSFNISPCTYGLFRPIIVVTGTLSDDELRLTLKHELVHIKRMDFLFLCLAYLASLLHFLNPLVFLFLKEFRKALEISCDEVLTDGLSDQERLAYGHMLINIQEALSGNEEEMPAGRLSCSNRELLRLRLYCLSRRQGKKKRFVFLLLFCLALTGAAFSLAVSTPPILIHWENGADSKAIQKTLQKVTWCNGAFLAGVSGSEEFFCPPPKGVPSGGS